MSEIKKKEWIDLNLDEIKTNITNTKKEIVLMQINKKTQQKIKPHEIKKKKHLLSQLLTLETLKLKSQYAN